MGPDYPAWTDVSSEYAKVPRSALFVLRRLGDRAFAIYMTLLMESWAAPLPRNYVETSIRKLATATKQRRSIAARVVQELIDADLMRCLGTNRRRGALYLIRLPAPANYRPAKPVESFEGMVARHYREVDPDRDTKGSASVPFGSHSVDPDRDTSGSHGVPRTTILRDSETRDTPPIVPPTRSIAVNPGTWPKHPRTWERWKVLRESLVATDPAFAVLPEAVAWFGKGCIGIKRDEVTQLPDPQKKRITRMLIDEGITEIRVCGGYE